MTTAKDEKSLTEKIAKLLRKAENQAATPEESESYYAMAQALMTKYAIDQMTVHAAMREGDADPLGALGKTVINVSKSYTISDALLVDASAKVNDCKVLMDKRHALVFLYGHETDRVQVEVLYTSLLLVMSREALAYGKASGKTGMPLYIARRSFREQFAVRIGQRLKEARQQAVTEYEKESGNSLLPMIQSKMDAVEKFAPRGRNTKLNQRHDWMAGNAGRAAANRADIGGPRLGGPAPKGAIG